MVTYLVRCTVTLAGSITVSPRYNGAVQNNLVSSATSTLTALTVSVSATFLTNTTSGAVTLDFLYSSSLLTNSPAGVFTVHEIQ